MVKPSTPQKPSKSASDLNPYVGATITYTLEGTVPAKANSFKFVDTPSAGLTVKLDTLKVNVQGETDPLANTEYTVDPASGDFNTSAAKPSFTIALNNATKYQASTSSSSTTRWSTRKPTSTAPTTMSGSTTPTRPLPPPSPRS